MKRSLTSGLMFLVLSLPFLSHAQQAGAPAPGAPTDSLPVAILVPAGTRIPMALTHPVRSRNAKSGTDVYALITSPVASGDEMAIPPGTYVQGRLEKHRLRSERAELQFSSLSITFPNGYVASVPGPITLESGDGYALKDAGNARAATAFIMPFAGLGLGALIGYAAHTADAETQLSTCTVPACPLWTVQSTSVQRPNMKGTALGMMIGGAAGGIGALVVLVTSHDFFLHTGSPLELTLRQPLSLNRDRVAEAIAKAKAHPVQPIVPPARSPMVVHTPLNEHNSPWDCPAGEEWCGGRCVGTGSFVGDSSNCGRCGNQCSFSETCTGGSCSCAPGYSSCMGSCVSDSSFIGDNSNCGRCGNSCSIGETCIGGSCSKL